MSFDPGAYSPVPVMVSMYSLRMVDEAALAAPPVSATYEGSAVAVYMPVLLSAGTVARRVWWANGATVDAAATVEVGLYADAAYAPGAKIISGSATQGTVSQVQFVDVTDTALAPGRYWLAVVVSSAATATLMGCAFSARYDVAYRMQEASASPLPTTATPVETTAAYLWLCGFATTASP